jgi:hypothetical protein
MSHLLSAARKSVVSLGWVNGSLYALGRALTARPAGAGSRALFCRSACPDTPLATLPKTHSTRVYRTSPIDDIIARFPRPAGHRKRFAEGRGFVAKRDGKLVGSSGSGTNVMTRMKSVVTQADPPDSLAGISMHGSLRVQDDPGVCATGEVRTATCDSMASAGR